MLSHSEINCSDSDSAFRLSNLLVGQSLKLCASATVKHPSAPVFTSSLSCAAPHYLAGIAARDLQNSLAGSEFSEGKMFGVLVVQHKGVTGYLAAFSGKLEGDWIREGFVPPPFDIEQMSDLLEESEESIAALSSRIDSVRGSTECIELLSQLEMAEREFLLSMSGLQQQHRLRKAERNAKRGAIKSVLQVGSVEGRELAELNATEELEQLARQSSQDKSTRKQLRREHETRLAGLRKELARIDSQLDQLENSRKLLSLKYQKRYFSLFQLQSGKGEPINLVELSADGLPAAGTGECAAPKLLAYARDNGYQPLTGCEFWWGPSPPGKVMHHASFYSPCQSKCGVLLPRMLDGLETLQTESTRPVVAQAPVNGIAHRRKGPSVLEAAGVEVLYEDESLVVVNKPAGLLSVPGKTERESVLSLAAMQWPDASGPLLVHRLDMDTSGILLIALNPQTHRPLQKQFQNREVKKRYSAVVQGRLSDFQNDHSGVICLPLRVDLDDRPRQMVCQTHGKFAQTRWKLLDEMVWCQGPVSQLEVSPVTGRTHQIRMHLASPQGLSMPIVGDPLYARRDGLESPVSRMMLHASGLEFRHPQSGNVQSIDCQANFL